MAAVEKDQIKTIYAIGNKLGMVGKGGDREDDLHLLIQALTGKASVKALSSSEAASVIADLKRRQGPQANSSSAGRKRQPEARPGGITAAQQGKVWALVGELEKYDTKPHKPGSHKTRLCAIIKKELQMDAAPGNPFAWITAAQGRKLIDALARYAENEERKALRRGGVRNG